MENLSDAEIIKQFLEKIKQEVIESQAQKGIRASGKSANLLRVEADENGGKLIDGSGTFYYQEYGRGAGKFPPLGAILEWLSYKKYGLNYANDAEKKSLAFLIGRSIAKSGTYTFRKGKSGVLTDVITSERVGEIVQQLKLKYLATASSEIIKGFKI